MSTIQYLVANTKVQSVVIVTVKVVNDDGLRVGKVGKNGPPA